MDRFRRKFNPLLQRFRRRSPPIASQQQQQQPLRVFGPPRSKANQFVRGINRNSKAARYVDQYFLGRIRNEVARLQNQTTRLRNKTARLQIETARLQQRKSNILHAAIRVTQEGTPVIDPEVFKKLNPKQVQILMQHRNRYTKSHSSRAATLQKMKAQSQRL